MTPAPVQLSVEPPPAWRSWAGWAVVALAFAVGAATDTLGAGHRVNLLAVPMLGVLAWNLAVYLALLVAAIAGRLGRGPRPPGPLRQSIAALAGRLRRLVANPRAARATRALHGHSPVLERRLTLSDLARTSAVLHAGAAALAAGLLASLYLRGLAFEYLAGWESTFLGPAAVRELLGQLLGPASALTGIALPDASRLAELRFSVGPGENAAPWINLYAVTLGLYVLLPRAVLAMLAVRTARRLERSDALLGAAPGITSPARRGVCSDDRSLASSSPAGPGPAQILALPYSFQLPAASVEGLRTLLNREIGAHSRLDLMESLSPEQAETLEGLGDRIASLRPTLVIALFSLSATPEPQTHAAFVSALRRRLPTEVELRSLVDETAFRARFAASPHRTDERRGAWRVVLGQVDSQPRFVVLGGLAVATAQATGGPPAPGAPA